MTETYDGALTKTFSLTVTQILTITKAMRLADITNFSEFTRDAALARADEIIKQHEAATSPLPTTEAH